MVGILDVIKWLYDFDKAKKMIENEEWDKEYLKGRMNDGIYLTTLVESLMTLEEPDGVIETAKRRQTDCPWK